MVDTIALSDGLKELRKAYSNILGFEMLQKIKKNGKLTAKITFCVKPLNTENPLIQNIILHVGTEDSILFIKVLTYDNNLIDRVEYNLDDFAVLTQKTLIYNGAIILLERNKLLPCTNMHNRDSKIAVVNSINLVNTGQPSNRDLYISNKNGVFVHVFESTPKVLKEIKINIEELTNRYKFIVKFKVKTKSREDECTREVEGSYNDLIRTLKFIQREIKRIQQKNKQQKFGNEVNK